MGGKSIHPKSFSPKVRNFFTFCILADRTPKGGKSQNTGFPGPFGLGQPLALREIPGQNRKTRFPGARGTFGGGNCPRQKFLPKVRNFFTFCVRLTWPLAMVGRSALDCRPWRRPQLDTEETPPWGPWPRPSRDVWGGCQRPLGACREVHDPPRPPTPRTCARQGAHSMHARMRSLPGAANDPTTPTFDLSAALYTGRTGTRD